jgi:hypothetical protein
LHLRPDFVAFGKRRYHNLSTALLMS